MSVARNEGVTKGSAIKNALKQRLLFRPVVTKDPRLLSSTTKGIIITCLALLASTPGFTSTIYFPGIPDITSDLHAIPIATTLTAALFILFMGIAPVFWASISDHYCMRRSLLIISMIIFSVSSLGLAFINNIWGMVVLRCVQSVGSSCGQSVGAGVIADCYPIEHRGSAFGKFFFGVFFGPLLGPIIGGFLIMSKDTWRSTFWFCFAFGVFIVIVVFLLLPETYRDNARFDSPTYTKESEPEPKEKPEENDSESRGNQESESNEGEKKTSKKNTLNPIASFLLLRHPFVLMASLVSGIAFGSMFAVETIIPVQYEKNYGFASWQTGLSYLGAGIGNVAGSVVGTYLSDRLLMRSRRKRNGIPMAEDRLTVNLWPAGAIIIPFGLLLFGWMVEFNKSVWGGIVGFGFVTFGMNMLMTSTSAYLVDAVPGAGASVAAAATLVRMVLACVLTLVANPMVSAIGSGWTSVLLAALSWLGTIILFCLKIWGKRLRQWSGFDDEDNS